MIAIFFMVFLLTLMGLTVALSYVVRVIMPGYHKISYLAIAFLPAFVILVNVFVALLEYARRHWAFGA